MPKYTVEPREVLSKYKVIAVVGASKNPEKDAYTVPLHMMTHGYTVIPVNPTTDSIHGLKTYPSLGDIPEDLAKTVDIVDVFRPSEEFPEVARKVVEMKKKTGRPFVFWGQLRLENEEAKKILEDAKVDYVMDRCLRIEYDSMSRGMGIRGKINEAWHSANRMPENPTREQRVKWHAEHAVACGCRDVPADLAEDVNVMIRASNQTQSA